MDLPQIVNFIHNLIDQAYHSHQGAVIRWLFILYTVVVIINIVIIISKTPNLLTYAYYGNSLKQKKRRSQKHRASGNAWDALQFKLNSANSDNWKLAIIEADKLFDQALIRANISGTTTGERLKNLVPGDLDGLLDSVWEAHRMRNNIVHQPGFEIDNHLARKTVKNFQDATKALKK
ncbi:MAG: hypothetical protein GF332_03970 [Candidatus Moranbacteria bacterium]|nr:hypothetical protein [Candidatus Moranbacteria bacterium]